MAEVDIIWPINKVKENYRFYYPNQEILLTQINKNQLSDDKGSGYSVLEMIGVGVLVVILVLVVYGLIVLGRFMRNKYFRP